MGTTQESRGSFTILGEAGYEELFLPLAKKWGADVIRDCDGTKLSPRLLEAGMVVYSTICIIHKHNEFASTNPQFQTAGIPREWADSKYLQGIEDPIAFTIFFQTVWGKWSIFTVLAGFWLDIWRRGFCLLMAV